MEANLFLDPLIQHGFLGLSAILLAILVWLIRKLLSILEETGSIISRNTNIITQLDLRSAELERLCGELRDRLLARPCIARREE